jgi:uncharacterized protein
LNVLAFDFRGHGDSSGHTATFGRREVQDVIAAEAFLTRRFSEQPVFVVGISYGAAVALQALPRLPHVRAAWLEGCFGTLLPVVEQKLAAVPLGLRCYVVPVYQALAWLDCGLWGSDIRPIDQLQRVQIPIFFCHGTEDELVPFSEGQALYAAYAGPKDCYWVPGASHYNIRRYHKDEYVRRLRGFLRELLESDSRPISSGSARKSSFISFDQ